MSWTHLENNPPWFVRLMARRKVRTKVVVAVSDEELAISAGISIDRLKIEDIEPLRAEIVELIDTVLAAPECDKTITAVREKVNGIMKEYPIFAW